MRITSYAHTARVDGKRLTHEYGPLHQVTLTRELTETTTEFTLAAGTVLPARTHTAYTYDENRPSDAAVSGLVTSAVTGATIAGYATDADTTTTTAAYDWSTDQEKVTTGAETLGTGRHRLRHRRQPLRQHPGQPDLDQDRRHPHPSCRRPDRHVGRHHLGVRRHGPPTRRHPRRCDGPTAPGHRRGEHRPALRRIRQRPRRHRWPAMAVYPANK